MPENKKLIGPEGCAGIHSNALRVLSELGVEIELPDLAYLLEASGGIREGSRVKFPAKLVERCISNADKKPIEFDRPGFGAHAGIYYCRFLDPDTGEMTQFNSDKLAAYIAFARSFREIRHVGILGSPFLPEGFRQGQQPMVEKLLAWKNGCLPEGAVHETSMCQALLNMFKCHAQAKGMPLENVFRAEGYMVSPLRMARPECEQLLWFRERGLRMGIGTMPSIGGTAPASIAGTLTLMLAEQIVLFIMNHALFGDNAFSLGVGCVGLDMRDASPCFGRPEQYRITIGMAEMAEFYGCACHGHSGLTDARLPTAEAGAQKAYSMMATASALGYASVSAGLMAVDEICSPVQMVLDVELVNALNALYDDINADDSECAADEIISAGCGGSHLGTEFTVERLHTGFWHSRAWSHGLISKWDISGKKTDADLALEVWQKFIESFEQESFIAADEERELISIIQRHASDSGDQ